jgi:hypothetical protein
MRKNSSNMKKSSKRRGNRGKIREIAREKRTSLM